MMCASVPTPWMGRSHSPMMESISHEARGVLNLHRIRELDPTIIAHNHYLYALIGVNMANLVFDPKAMTDMDR